MKIIIDSRIHVTVDSVPPEVLTKIKQIFKYRNPDYFKKRNMGFFTGNTSQYIVTYRLDDGGETLSLPRGGLNRFLELLYGTVENIELLDGRHTGNPVEYTFDPNFQPRPYQEQAVERILEAETCILKAGAGAGKTECVLLAISRAGLRAGILVGDKNLQSQWITRIEKRLLIPRDEIGIVGGGKFRIGKKVTVAMIQTSRNRLPELKDRFGFIVYDEVHRAAANTHMKVTDAFAAKFRVGLTATVRRQDLKHFIVHDLFGEIAFEITRDQLEDQGFLTKIVLHVIPTNFQMDYLNEKAIQEAVSDRRFIDYETLNAREKRDIADDLGLPRRNYPEYLTECSSDRERNNLIFRYVKAEYNKGSKIIIFTKRRSHCTRWQEALAKIGIDVAIIWGSQNRKEAKRISNDLDRMRRGEVQVAIGTTADESIDLPIVDCGVVTYRNSKNAGQLEQQAGRLARLFVGKQEGRLYYLWDQKIERFKNDVKDLRKHFDQVIVHDENEKILRTGR